MEKEKQENKENLLKKYQWLRHTRKQGLKTTQWQEKKGQTSKKDRWKKRKKKKKEKDK